MKWILVFIVFCFAVIPAMGETVDTTISETDTLPALSSENAQALVVFNDLLAELNAIAGKEIQTDAKSDELLLKLMVLFLEEDVDGYGIFLKNLLDSSLDDSAVSSDEVMYGGRAPIYITDSMATLFYLAGNIAENNSEHFIENLIYLEELIPSMEAEDNINSEYIEALKSAVDEWKIIYTI